jgi:hypothetical protein
VDVQVTSMVIVILEEIENVKYLDFDGDDFVDEDFDGFIGKKAKARREVRQTNRAVNNSSKFTSYDDCMAKKPLLISKKHFGVQLVINNFLLLLKKNKEYFYLLQIVE